MPRTAAAALVAAATIAAIVERLWFPRAWGEAGSLTSVFYYGDATRFVDAALAIARGQLYDNGIPYHPPGWPLLIAAVIRWAGGTVPVARIKLLVAILSGLSVGVSTLLAEEMAGIGAAAAVALLAPFDFGHIVEGTVANSEALYGLLVAVAAWATWRWCQTPADGVRHRVTPLAAGLVAALAGGAATLVRAEYLAAAVVTTLFAWTIRRRASEVLAYAAIFCAVLAPTTVWHWQTLSAFNASHVGRVAGPLPRFAPVTSYGPFNFAMANHEDADGGPNRDHPMLDLCRGDAAARLGAGQLDVACPAIYDLYVNGYGIGARWLLGNPVAAAALFAGKVEFTIGFLAHGFLADDVGAGVDGVRRRVDLVDPSRWWLAPVRLLLIAAGIVALRRRPVALAVLAAPVAALAGSTLLFYGYVRLGVAYLPIVWVFEGAGCAAIAFALTGRRAGTRAVVAALVAMTCFVAYDRVSRDRPRGVTIDGHTTADGRLQQDETLEIHAK